MYIYFKTLTLTLNHRAILLGEQSFLACQGSDYTFELSQPLCCHKVVYCYSQAIYLNSIF